MNTSGLKTQIIDVLSKGIALGGYRFIPVTPSKTSEFLFGGVYQSSKSLSLSFTCTYTCTHTQMHIRTCTCSHTCAHIHMFAYRHSCTCVCTNRWAHIHAHVCAIHMCARACTDTRAPLCPHTCTQTDTWFLPTAAPPGDTINGNTSWGGLGVCL